MDELNADEYSRRGAGQLAMVLVNQADEPPLGVAQRVLAQFGQLLLPVFGPPKAAANWRMAHALEIFVGRDGARVAVTILAAGQCFRIG